MQPPSPPISDLLFFLASSHFELSYQITCFSANGKGDLISGHWPNR
jgi:hypothetical protein